MTVTATEQLISCSQVVRALVYQPSGPGVEQQIPGVGVV
jgi:hypothetical protein